jgi:hypothetical protein
MSFEGRGILTLGLEFGLQLLDEKFEAQHFTSQLLDLRRGAAEGRCARAIDGCWLGRAVAAIGSRATG